MMNILRPYYPLIVLTVVSAIAGYFIASGNLHFWMHSFMGLALCIFAMLKLFNPQAFANGFQKYDLLAKRCRPYAYIYPYIELTLGCAYLGQAALNITYIATIGLFGFGLVGVGLAMRRGLDANCACMGNILNVPLSKVTLAENISMIAMALFMIL